MLAEKSTRAVDGGNGDGADGCATGHCDGNVIKCQICGDRLLSSVNVFV